MGLQKTPRSDALVGRIVGPYRVKARLRETGGLTTVIAEHVHLDRQVLLKWVTPASPAVLLRVKEQARALSRLKHRNLLPVSDFGESAEGVVYLAFELGDDAPLRSVLVRRKPLPWWEARRLGRQIASAVRAAQAVSLPLAEVSPSAVFLAPVDGGVRVDLATPELLGLSDPSLVADQVHGLGRVLYLMVTGHDTSANAEQVPADPVLSWPELEIPSDADALIMRAVDPVAASRWASLEVLERELGGGEVEEAVPALEGGSRGWSAGSRFTAARFSEPQPVDDANDDRDYEDHSFGRRAFARPSKRALISGGVAVAAGTVLLAGIVMSRGPLSPSEKNDAGARLSNPSPSPVEVAADEARRSAETTPAAVRAPAEVMPVEATAAASGTASTAPPPAPGGSAPVADVFRPPATAGVQPPSAAVSGRPGPVPGRAEGSSAAPASSGVAALQPSLVAAAGGTGGAATSGGVPGTAVPAADPIVAGLPGGPPAPTNANARTAEPTVVAAPAPGGACAVSLGSRPWADVWFDGRRMGFTPLTDLAVPCGQHDILFTSPGLGLERRISITLRAGEPLKRIVDLEAAPLAAPGQGSSEGSGGIAGVAAGCRLSLGSRPWSEVWVDGKRAGITPLTAVPVVCGKHDLLFLSRDANVEHRESIEVLNGQLLKRTVVLVEGD